MLSVSFEMSLYFESSFDMCFQVVLQSQLSLFRYKSLFFVIKFANVSTMAKTAFRTAAVLCA